MLKSAGVTLLTKSKYQPMRSGGQQTLALTCDTGSFYTGLKNSVSGAVRRQGHATSACELRTNITHPQLVCEGRGPEFPTVGDSLALFPSSRGFPRIISQKWVVPSRLFAMRGEANARRVYVAIIWAYS